MFLDELELLNARMQPLFEHQMYAVVFAACLAQCTMMMENAGQPRHSDATTWMYLSRQILAEMMTLVDSRDAMRES